MQIIIGYTRSDRAADYISHDDGYRPGARQETVRLVLLDQPGLGPQAWAEAVFVATNRPGTHHSDEATGVAAVTRALREHAYRSLSVGDTITVIHDNGHTDSLACQKTGWEPIAEPVGPTCAFPA